MKIINTIKVLLIGDYVLDEMTKHKKIKMFPSPYKYFRDRYIESKSNKQMEV